MRTPDGGRLRFGPVEKRVLAPSKSFLQEALVRDLDPRPHHGGDDVVFDFSIRVRATSDDVEDASGGGPVSSEINEAGKHRHSKAESSGAKSAVRLRAHGVQSLELPARAQAVGSVNRMRLAVYLASRQVRRKLNMVAS